MLNRGSGESLLKLQGFLFLCILWKPVEVADTPFLLLTRFHIPQLVFCMLFADCRTAAAENLHPDCFFPAYVTWFLHADAPDVRAPSASSFVPSPCLGLFFLPFLDLSPVHTASQFAAFVVHEEPVPRKTGRPDLFTNERSIL